MSTDEKRSLSDGRFPWSVKDKGNVFSDNGLQKADNVRQGLLGVILAGPVLFPPGLYDDLSVAGLLLAFLFTGRQRLLDALHSKGLWLLFALLGWMLVSLFWSDGVSRISVMADWLPGILSVLLFVLLVITIKPEGLSNVLLAVAVFISAIALLSMVWQFSVLDRAFA
ncbi:hypothetical protein [Endozoicomonas sp.]|uniref:hypothetical protein n=1 Tax=Endozoicomonas sp. TaxID=1892382 RepID=UPI00383AF3C2